LLLLGGAATLFESWNADGFIDIMSS
jgi:hypothetical protein